MSRPVAVLRPAPGNRATADRLRALGLLPIELPLFSVQPISWTPPDPGMFDGLLLTSANALRHGGPGLDSLRSLPVLAVGTTTARAAQNRGFFVERAGNRDLRALLADLAPTRRLLWLAGADRTAIDHPALAQVMAIYRSVPLPIDPSLIAGLNDSVALLHSARAAQRAAGLIDDSGVPRRSVRIAAISDKVAAAAGTGWASIAVAAAPNDPALVATARLLAIDP